MYYSLSRIHSIREISNMGIYPISLLLCIFVLGNKVGAANTVTGNDLNSDITLIYFKIILVRTKFLINCQFNLIYFDKA